MGNNTLMNAVQEFFEENIILVQYMQQEWEMSKTEVLREILKTGAKEEMATIKMMREAEKENVYGEDD